jgi:hypothetical protein
VVKYKGYRLIWRTPSKKPPKGSKLTLELMVDSAFNYEGTLSIFLSGVFMDESDNRKHALVISHHIDLRLDQATKNDRLFAT